MRRPFGLWLLLAIVAVWLKVQDVYSLRATSLIFPKTTTTTTTTTTAPPETSEETAEHGVTEASGPKTETQNETNQLTGIPQIDYIWDPNLPRELNGYNLSEYPFYDRVPKKMDFKCDGLHDGFYASVAHKCQVYHHCLAGVRYDFLCANYTAFDQRTFICHFVSEVDCLNSKNFWHRNDALYKATTTTTVKPPPTPPQPIYTLPPQPADSAVPIVPILGRRPERPRRPYPRRPRPYDYYDDEYDEEEYYEKPARRQRPRYRPRVYDDEYEYEEDDYIRRPNGRRNENRRPYKSRGANRRRPYDDEQYDDQDDDRKQDGGRRNSDEGGKRPLKSRPLDSDDRRPHDRPRNKGYRRPIDDEYEEDPPPRRLSDRRKNKNREENRKNKDGQEEEEMLRKTSNRNDRPRNSYDRKREDEFVGDDKPKSDRDRNNSEESSSNEKPTGNNERNKNEENDDRPLQKPPSSIYERKRPTLKVRPPVPIREQAKYSPKVLKSTTPEPAEEDYYYDEVEEDTKQKEESRRSYAADSSRKFTTTTQASVKRDYQGRRKLEPNADELEPSTRREKPKRPRYGEDTFGSKDARYYSNRKVPVQEEYDDYEENKSEKVTNNSEKSTTTAIKEPPREPVVKVLKRPFLPSRGGNPYTSRGLLPVGSKAMESSSVDETQETQNLGRNPEVKSSTSADDDRPFKQPIVVKVATRNNQDDEEFKTVPNRPATRIVKIPSTSTTTTTTTEEPKIVERNPLDLDENEYDVTLNDALNPTLPNLPIRNFPTGFSSQNDYTYNAVQRPRYVIDPVINQASSDYVYRIEQPEANNIRYKSVPVYQSFRQSPRVTQAIYSPY